VVVDELNDLGPYSIEKRLLCIGKKNIMYIRSYTLSAIVILVLLVL